MTSDLPRRAAADLLLAVEGDGAYANLVLPGLLRDRDITGRDARFATEIGYGTLRYQGCLDAVIEAAARRPVDRLDTPVRAVLRLGAYQLLHTRVAPHAAVSANVDLAKQMAGPRTAGLVNAVLRKVSQRDWDGWVRDVAPRDPLGRLAFARGYPRWIAEAWQAALGGGTAELRDALGPDRPVTHLVARPGRISRDALLRQCGPQAQPGPWSSYAVRLTGGGVPGDLPAVRDGAAAVQDEGSQLVALVLARALLNGPDMRWLDQCAGPGGKAALLAGLMSPGGRLYASDLHPHRARQVARALGASNAGRVVTADVLTRPWRSGSFDRLLLDVPCTGLGSLRRRPDLRWRRQPSDVARLHRLQVDLLRTALDEVRPGGLVAYATCSPHPGETTDVVSDVLDGRRDVEPVDVRPLLSDVPALGPGPAVQLWPHRHGTDAMFVALLRRRDALH